MTSNDRFFDSVMTVALMDQSDDGVKVDEMRVVHGFLTPEHRNISWGLIGDFSRSFAWIEVENIVFIHGVCFLNYEDRGWFSLPCDAFYEKYRPTFLTRYKTDQAVEMKVKTGNNGPWEVVLLSIKPSLPEDEDTRVTNKIRAMSDGKK